MNKKNKITPKNQSALTAQTLWKPFIAPAFLAIITAFVYSFSLHYDFQFDDIVNIRTHFAIRNETFWNLAFKAPRWISYWLNTCYYQLGEFNPFYYRMFNILFHITTGILIFYSVRNMLTRLTNNSYFQSRAYPIAFTTALIFLLHPVQTQTISYVVQGQLEGLASLFMMTCILLFLKLTQSKNMIFTSVLTAALFSAGYVGCGTKEIAILSPLMLLLVDWFFVAQGSWSSFKKRIILHFLFAGLIGYAYVEFLKPSFFKEVVTGSIMIDNNVGNIITIIPHEKITPLSYFISEFKVILHYIFIFIWPFCMSVDYDWKMVTGFFALDCFLPFLALLLIAVGIIFLIARDKTSVIGFSILWFFCGLAPRSTIIPSTELLADYKTYFSSFGICLLLALIAIYAFEWTQKQLLKKNFPAWICSSYTAIALGTLVLGAATYQRNLVWSSAEIFWAAVIKHSPLKARAYNNYGTALAEQNQHQKALLAFKRALKLDPFYPDPWNNLSVTYDKLGNVDKAISTMENALKVHTQCPEFYNNLGSFFLKKGNFEKSVELCTKAIAMRPHYGKAYHNIGRAKMAMGKKLEGWEYFKKSVTQADYDITPGFEAYANASMQVEKYKDAIVGFSQILKNHPHAFEAKFNLANAYYCDGNFDKAEKMYLGLIKEKPSDWRLHYNLGELYWISSGAQKALPCLEKAEPLAGNTLHVKQRIALCKKQVHEKNRS